MIHRIQFLPGQTLRENLVWNSWGNDEVQNIVPNLGEGQSLFFRIIIRYRGPFTAGHETSACWRYNESTGRMIEYGRPRIHLRKIKRIAERIRQLQPEASNRQIAKVLGVDHQTINNDMAGENSQRTAKNPDAKKERPPALRRHKRPKSKQEEAPMLRGWGATPTYKTIAISGSIERRFTERYEGLWKHPHFLRQFTPSRRRPSLRCGNITPAQSK